MAFSFPFSESSHLLPSDTVLKQLSVVQNLEIWETQTGEVGRRFTFLKPGHLEATSCIMKWLTASVHLCASYHPNYVILWLLMQIYYKIITSLSPGRTGKLSRILRSRKNFWVWVPLPPLYNRIRSRAVRFLNLSTIDIGGWIINSLWGEEGLSCEL